MSKRHQSSRRRTYGRRQHEVRERHDRTPEHEAAAPFELEAWGATPSSDPFAFRDPTTPHLRYALGD